jgi:tRNA pseudouridine32 synthase/23S rRNA pseudouridine746 synthase
MEWKIMLAKGKKRAYIADFGKECITRAHCAGIVQRLGKEWSRWLLKPLTGRPHQLRFEMARHGYPIAGDQLYGSSSLWLDGKHGIALRATELDFTQWDQAIDFGLPSRVGVSELGLNDGTK